MSSVNNAMINANLSNTGSIGHAGQAALMTAVASKDKGSIGNRTNYLAEQTKENFKTALKQDAVVIGGTAVTAGATIVTKNSKTVQNLLTKGFVAIKNSKFGDGVKEMAKEVKPYLSKAVGYVKNLPGPAKAVLAAGTIITALASERIYHNHIAKSGQIDQKYTDKAKMEKTLA